MRIILASQSPRRKELLSLITKDFEVIVSDDDEIVDKNLPAIEQVKLIASNKAHDVAEKIEGDSIIIGSDTIVVVDEEILGKPKDEENAIYMLKKLNGRYHEVMTGISVIVKEKGKVIEHNDVCVTKVHIKDMTNEEIKKWLNTGNAWDKAGAYAVQQEFAVHVDKIEGNFASVMGFPVHDVYDIIKKYI